MQRGSVGWALGARTGPTGPIRPISAVTAPSSARPGAPGPNAIGGFRPAAPKFPPPSGSVTGVKRVIGQVTGAVAQAPRAKLQTIRPWVPKNALLAVRDPPCLGILQHASLEQCGVGHAFDTEETVQDVVRNKSQRVSRCSKCGSAMVVITSRVTDSRKVRFYNFGGEDSQ
mmetsp:Transcript_93302/g.251833  ORF Transcript_93302/g.251833 Transcript_93302/m.251833 type:complete len:171 (+) Transcript_93302:97-609(+)